MSARHPSIEMLALAGSGDLGLFDRMKVRWHTRSCAICAGELAAFAGVRAETRAAAGELPEGLDWDRLASEMAANVRLGVAAGECVAEPRRREAFGFFAPVAGVCAAVVLVAGAVWTMRVPPVEAPAAHAGVVLETTSEGIEVQQDGAALALMHRTGGPAAISAGAGGLLRARYIDEETGQVTIHHVYAE
jgi:hypothetical protein